MPSRICGSGVWPGPGAGFAVRMGFRLLGHRHQDQAAVPHAPLRDDVVREMPDLLDRAAQHRDLHAAVVVEVHVQRRERQVVMLVG